MGKKIWYFIVWLFTSSHTGHEVRFAAIMFFLNLVITLILLSVARWFRMNFFIRINQFSDIPVIDQAIFWLWGVWLCRLFWCLAKFLYESCEKMLGVFPKNITQLSQSELENLLQICSANELFLWGLLIATFLFLIWCYTPVYYFISEDAKIVMKIFGLFLAVCWILLIIIGVLKIVNMFTIVSFVKLISSTNSFRKACVYVLWNGLLAVLTCENFILYCVVCTSVLIFLISFCVSFVKYINTLKLTRYFFEKKSIDKRTILVASVCVVCLFFFIKYCVWYLMLDSSLLVFIKLVCKANNIPEYMIFIILGLIVIILLLIFFIIAVYFIMNAPEFINNDELVFIIMLVINLTLNNSFWFTHFSAILTKCILCHSFLICVVYIFVVILIVFATVEFLLLVFEIFDHFFKVLERNNMDDFIIYAVYVIVLICTILLFILNPTNITCIILIL